MKSSVVGVVEVSPLPGPDELDNAPSFEPEWSSDVAVVVVSSEPEPDEPDPLCDSPSSSDLPLVPVEPPVDPWCSLESSLPPERWISEDPWRRP